MTNQRGYKKNYYYDAFERLVKVEELNASHALYSTTTYSYDVLNNLKQVVDNSSNTITMNYDWLSRKTSMSDPDMGSWSYGYDNNSNLTSQTDAKSQTIVYGYDELNRLRVKLLGGFIWYFYDSTTDGNYGKGRRTGMSDASGSTTYKYDARGRLIEEKRTIDSVNYTTSFGYDSADRQTTVTYPTGEVVTQTYNGRGLPYTLSGSVAGNIVTSTLYNKLGQYTEINLNNGIKTTFGYWGVGGTYDTTGGYYGRLWEIKSAVGSNVRQDVKYTWDAGGNLASRQDVKFGGTENFTYDFLDRLTAVSSAYSHTYTYNQIGNIISMNGSSYTYGSSKPHGVTQVGSTTYSYDNNGNMISRGGTTITWNVENRPTAVGTATFVYDGDGNRVKKIEGGQTTVYIGKYYEKNTSTGVITTYYYLGDKLVALRNGTNLRYIHQDSLGSTSVVTNSSGAQYGYTRYYPYGSTRNSSGSLDTDKKFTGQRLDGTGLYYYGARYYDPSIGRFISADTVGSSPLNPQSYNRYSYCFNNPLAFIDPTGNWGLSNICKWAKDNVVAPIKETAVDVGKTVVSAAAMIADPSLENAKEFGTNLGNAALGRGTVDAIAGAIETGDWKTAALNITMAGVQVASNFVAPGGGKILTSMGERGFVRVAGKAGEEALLSEFGGMSRVVKNTSLGRRVIDNLAGGVARESKEGYTCLTKRVQSQIAKDIELVNNPKSGVLGAQWHFFPGMTGTMGPSGPLRKALEEAGIKIVLH